MRRKFFVALPFLLIAAGFIGMRFFAGFQTAPPRKAIAPPLKYVHTRIVALQDIKAEISAYGRLRSSQPVTLYSEVTGRLEPGDAPFLPGQIFRRDDLIVKIDDRQIRLNINTAKSELLNALAQVLPEIRVDFPEEYPVWQTFFNQCFFDRALPDIPPAAHQNIKLYLSRFNVYKIYFSIRDLEIVQEKHFFSMPFDGAITSAELRIGSNVRPGTRIGDIINLEHFEAEMPVQAEDVRWIMPGAPVVLTSAELDGVWSGRVLRIGKAIDTRTQTVQVYIGLEQDGDARLYDGVFMKAVIPGPVIANAVVVPRTSLYEQGFVYVIEDGRLAYRPIRIARSEPDAVIVNGGLHDGDELVEEVLQGVAPGMPARARSSLAAKEQE